MELLVREPFERVQHRRVRAGLPRHRLGESWRDEGLEEDGRCATLLNFSHDSLEVVRGRLRLWRQPGDRDLLEAVSVGEIAERSVARDDLLPVTPGETALEVRVEHHQPGDKGLRRTLERIADASRLLGVAERIEPDMRIDAIVSGDQVQPLKEIELLAVCAVHSSFEVGLEAGAEIEDYRGRTDPLDVASRELDVVRLGSGWREVPDLDLVAPDLLGRVRKGIERRRDRDAAASRPLIAAASGTESKHGDKNENDSHYQQSVQYSSMTAWEAHARATLAGAGRRAGRARELVISLLAVQQCCLSANEIFDSLRTKDRRIGLASVYRALDQLVGLQLVQRLEFADGARYEPLLPSGEHHHHLMCDDCGKVEPFADGGLERALDRVGGDLCYRVEAHDVLLRGACADCRT